MKAYKPAAAVILVIMLAATACGTDTAEAPLPDATSDAMPEPAPVDPVPSDDHAPEAPAAEDDESAQPDLGVAVTLTEVGRVGSAIAAVTDADGTLYVADRVGTVHVLDGDGVGPPVVDITDETTTDGERGLLGLALSPDGAELFVSFTDANGASRIDAFTLPTNARRTILTLEQPFANHNGGDIAFGPDGLLYIGIGDGGGSGDPLDAGQDLTTLLGAVLRIDPFNDDPYAIPDDNPFVGNGDVRSEIVFFGLRNPWRFSFDRETGDVWIADVGQRTREEINRLDPVVDRGANLGWAAMEGTTVFKGPEPDDHHAPVFEYDTTSQRCAITGGYVYRGNAIPELRGAYLFSDYCEGLIRAIVVDDDGAVVDEGDLGVNGGRVVAFAQDNDGELYVLALDGTVARLDPA